MPTINYYFSQSNFRPYIGLGAGYYFLTTSKDVFINGDPVNNAYEANVANQIGILLRGGFNLHKCMIGKLDLSKLIIGLEFNYIPKADVEIFNGNNQKVGILNISNIALSFGYTIGKIN